MLFQLNALKMSSDVRLVMGVWIRHCCATTRPNVCMDQMNKIVVTLGTIHKYPGGVGPVVDVR